MKNLKNCLLGGVILVFLAVWGCSGSDKKKSGGGGGGNTNTEVNNGNGGGGNENDENSTPEAKFSVTFYLNKADAGSGENPLENPAPQSVAEKGNAKDPGEIMHPENLLFKFVEWRNADADATWNFTSPVMGPLKLYAHWNKNYSVTFYANKADAGSGENPLENPAPQSVAEDAMAKKPDYALTNKDANFTGLPDGQEDKIVHTTWVNIEDGEVWNFTQNKVDKNLKLYAKIFPKIEVASADARKYPTNPTYPTNKEAGFADEADENAQYFAYFDGWFKTEDDSSWEFKEDSTEKLILYGKWRETIKQAKAGFARPFSSGTNDQYTPDTLYALLYHENGSRKTKEEGRFETNQIDTSLVTDMGYLFYQKSTFDDPIGGWNTTLVKNMSVMFYGASEFNRPIGGWNTGEVTHMNNMFHGASKFNQPIGKWNTGEVTEMNSMFEGASEFNRPIGKWNTGEVTHMRAMFYGASKFNQPIGNWNIERLGEMKRMFYGAETFNQDLSQWKPVKASNMYKMFEGARDFVQDMSSWDNWKPNCLMTNNAGEYGSPEDMFKDSGIEGIEEKYPTFYKELEKLQPPSNRLKASSGFCTPP